MLDMSPQIVDDFYGELPRINALRDIRMLDLILVPHADDNDYWRHVRTRLLHVIEHGKAPDLQKSTADQEREAWLATKQRMNAFLSVPGLMPGGK